MKGFGAIDNFRSTASFCRATSPCPLLFVTYFYVTPVAVERFVYTFESTSLLLQPHSQFVLGENVVKIPVHH